MYSTLSAANNQISVISAQQQLPKSTINVATFCSVDTQAKYYNQTFVAT